MVTQPIEVFIQAAESLHPVKLQSFIKESTDNLASGKY